MLIHKYVKHSTRFYLWNAFLSKNKNSTEILDCIRHFGDSRIDLYNVYDYQAVDMDGNTQGQDNGPGDGKHNRN